MGFSRQAYWSGLPFLSPGDLPDPWIKPGFPVSQADSLPSEPAGKFNHKENNMQSWLYENWAFAYQKIFRKWKEKVQSEKIIHKENLGLPWWAQTVQNLPAMQETRIWHLVWEDPLKEGMETHSSILAWRIPRTEEPYRSTGLQRVQHDWVTNTHTHKENLGMN